MGAGVTVHLVRHLAPRVAPGLCYGRTDLAVDPAAIAAALPRLRARLPAGLPIYSSPLRRCADLARALGDTIIDPRLTELDFGAWEMQAWDAIARDEIDAWAADMAHYRPGGGESVAAMAARVLRFYDELPAGPSIVICHAGTMRLLATCGRGLDAEAMARRAAATPNPIGYGTVVPMRRV